MHGRHEAQAVAHAAEHEEGGAGQQRRCKAHVAHHNLHAAVGGARPQRAGHHGAHHLQAIAQPARDLIKAICAPRQGEAAGARRPAHGSSAVRTLRLPLHDCVGVVVQVQIRGAVALQVLYHVGAAAECLVAPARLAAEGPLRCGCHALFQVLAILVRRHAAGGGAAALHARERLLHAILWPAHAGVGRGGAGGGGEAAVRQAIQRAGPAVNASNAKRPVIGAVRGKAVIVEPGTQSWWRVRARLARARARARASRAGVSLTPGQPAAAACRSCCRPVATRPAARPPPRRSGGAPAAAAIRRATPPTASATLRTGRGTGHGPTRRTATAGRAACQY